VNTLVIAELKLRKDIVMGKEFKTSHVFNAPASTFQSKTGQQFVIAAPDSDSLEEILTEFFCNSDYYEYTTDKFQKVKVVEDDCGED